MIATIKNPKTGKMDMAIVPCSDGGVQVGYRKWGNAVQFLSHDEAVAAINKACGKWQPTDKNNLVMVEV